MGLTSRAFTIFCVVAAVAAPAATMLLWARVKGPAVVRGLQRFGLIVVCQLLAIALVGKLPRDLRREVAKVVSPAMGGVIIGHEVGRALGVEAMFVERPTGTFELRRGFSLNPGDKVLMVEDVVTTGLSSREAILAIEAAGGEVIAATALIDRSGGTVDLGVPFHPLIALSFPTYAPDALPPELAASPAVKPGSRTAA